MLMIMKLNNRKLVWIGTVPAAILIFSAGWYLGFNRERSAVATQTAPGTSNSASVGNPAAPTAPIAGNPVTPDDLGRMDEQLGVYMQDFLKIQETQLRAKNMVECWIAGNLFGLARELSAHLRGAQATLIVYGNISKMSDREKLDPFISDMLSDHIRAVEFILSSTEHAIRQSTVPRTKEVAARMKVDIETSIRLLGGNAPPHQ
jgi:hypothetical protein